MRNLVVFIVFLSVNTLIASMARAGGGDQSDAADWCVEHCWNTKKPLKNCNTSCGKNPNSSTAPSSCWPLYKPWKDSRGGLCQYEVHCDYSSQDPGDWHR